MTPLVEAFTPGHRENRPLTALRGLAALWVVGHHVFPAWHLDPATGAARFFSIAYVAVDVFFVLSGFILATVYVELRMAGVPAYTLRRLCRVFPLHWAVLAGLALVAAVGPNAAAPHPWGELLPVVLMLQSYVLPDTPWNPPTWSIGVELLAYALLPFGVALARHGRGSQAAAWVAVALFAAAEFETQRWFTGAVVGPGAIVRGLAGFFLGVAMAAARVPGHPWPNAAASAIQAAAVVLFAAGLWLGDPALPPLAAAMLITALADERGWLARPLSSGVLVWLGAISYSLYLLHTPLLVLVGRLPIPPTARGFILVILLLSLSTLTWRFIEQPGRRLPGLFQRFQHSGQQRRARRELAP